MPGTPPVIHSIGFREGTVEIQYMEERDQVEHIGLMKVLVFETRVAEAQVDSLLSDIVDLLDLVVDKMRNPPMTRPSGMAPKGG